MLSIRNTAFVILLLGIVAPVRLTISAQMPGVPVLQNAFANPGVTAALDVAGLGGATSYVAAFGWAPGTARLQFSGGVGLQTRSNSSTRTLYGGRLNIPVLGATSSLGISLFGGWGGLTGGTIDSTVTKSLVPLGATVGYRKAIGETRGFSIYGSPIYEWAGRGSGASAVSVFRGAIGLDLGVTKRLGVTLGIEFGGSYPVESGKPSGTAFGGAVSYAFSAGR